MQAFAAAWLRFLDCGSHFVCCAPGVSLRVLRAVLTQGSGEGGVTRTSEIL